MLLPWSGFYEFLPTEEEGETKPLRMDQLEVGKEYELVVTNLSGFYRYRLGDVVRVTGYHHECPKLVVAYRKNQLISMYDDLKIRGGASPNQIKPLHVVSSEKLRRFFFRLLQDYQDM